MRINSRIRGRILVLAALTVVVSLPELARAQQTGLFPLHPIKRHRVPCDQEDPIYKTYKHEYFGYHPTCWRVFPAGWGCPSPEAPDKEKSFKETPLATGEPRPAPEPGEPEEGMEGQPPRPSRPPLPGGGRSPFEEEPEKPATSPTTPRGGRTPLPTPPAGDPFELDNKPNIPATPKPAQERPAAPGSASNSRDLSAPAEHASSIQGDRSTRNEESGEANDRDETAPTLAVPSVNVPALGDPGSPSGTMSPAHDSDVASNAAPAAGNSASRRGFLSGFFNNLGLNWVRR